MAPGKRKNRWHRPGLRWWLTDYLRQTRSLGNSLLFITPLLVVYNVGLVLTGPRVMNGADFVSGHLFDLLGARNYMLLQPVLLLAAVIVVLMLRRRGSLNLRHFPLLLVECGVYASLMGTLILLAMHEVNLLLLGSVTPPGGGLTDVFVISAGAGFYEELVFRLLLLGSLWRVLAVFMHPVVAGVAAVALTSVLFSLAHYLGPEEFAWFSFWYRSFAGVIFATLFMLRGFAVAVYTHALYNIFVFLR